MWVARDKLGNLHLFSDKPERHISAVLEYWRRNEPYSTIALDDNMFPDLKWEDDPVEVCLCINNEKYHTVKVEILDKLYKDREILEEYRKLPWYKRIFKRNLYLDKFKEY